MLLTKIKVVTGSLLINHAVIYKKSKDICVVIVDMKSKRGEIIAIGNNENNCPELYIDATPDSIYLNPKCKKNVTTQIIFKDFKDWNIITASIIKYSIYVCLVKGD